LLPPLPVEKSARISGIWSVSFAGHEPEGRMLNSPKGVAAAGHTEFFLISQNADIMACPALLAVA